MEKRPSEFKSNSWLYTYKNDPIKNVRVKLIKSYRNGDISKCEAQARIVVAEHDDHFQAKGITWEYPEEVDAFRKEELQAIVFPDSEKKFKLALIESLKEKEQFWDNIENIGIQIIIYSYQKHSNGGLTMVNDNDNNSENEIEPEVEEFSDYRGSKDIRHTSSDLPQVDLVLDGLGLVAHSISTITYYKYKTKELEVRKGYIEKQFQLAEKGIDSALNLELAEIKRRQSMFKNEITLVEKNLGLRHIERRDLTSAVIEITKKLLDSELPIDHKKALNVTLKTLTEQLKDLGERGTAELRILAQSTEKVIEASYKNKEFFPNINTNKLLGSS